MQINKLRQLHRWAVVVLAGTMGLLAAGSVMAQDANQPWMNSSLSPEERAELVLKQMTLDEKIALLHGNGMQHASAVADAPDPSLQRRRRLRGGSEAAGHSPAVPF